VPRGLKQIGTAMVMYFPGDQRLVPVREAQPARRVPRLLLRRSTRGGRTGGATTDARFSATRRAAGRSISTSTRTCRPGTLQPTDPEFDGVRKMPIFECPSDTGGFWNNDPGENTTGPKSLYWETGNSYDENYHFVGNWAIPRESQRWLQKANASSRSSSATTPRSSSSRYEDPFDSAQWLRIPRRGWHKKFNKHSFLFLDAHADNMYTDTPKGTSGRGWKSCSGNASGDPKAWWNWIIDPD